MTGNPLFVDQLTPRECFDRTLSLASQGKLQDARSLCAQFIERNPADVNNQALLGAVLIALQNSEQAIPHLRRAVDMAPGHAKAQADLGQALLNVGKPEEAVIHLQEATQLDPSMELAFFKLGQALAMVNRPEDADQAFEASFRLSPERAALAQAAEHHRAGRFEEAETIYRNLLKQDPDNINALRLLSKLAIEYSRFADAETLLQRIVTLAPNFVDAWLDLSAVMKEQEMYDEAVECVDHAVQVAPRNAHAQYVRAGMLAMAGYTYDAVDAYRKSLQLAPEHAAAYMGLGHVLKTIGKQQEGIDAYRDALRLNPDFGEVYWSLANLKTFRFDDNEVLDMEKRLANPQLSTDHRIHFCLTLAKAYEDRQEFETAFAYYQRGNNLQRQQVAYDPVSTETMHDRIIGIFSDDRFERNKDAGHPATDPIFIVGLPRSGSTLIEQILASHSMVDGTSELPDLGRTTTTLSRQKRRNKAYPEAVAEVAEQEFAAFGGQYMKTTRRHRQDAPFFTDKMPNNFPTIGFLHLILPNAKIIDARRNPVDSCLGCYKQLFAKGQNFTYDLVELGEFYLQYDRIMKHWDAVLPGRVLHVDYERVVADTEGEIRRILDYCELPWEDACFSFYETDRAIKTASSEQVRKPIYDSSVDFWKNYEQQLQPLIEVLQPLLNG